MFEVPDASDISAADVERLRARSAALVAAHAAGGWPDTIPAVRYVTLSTRLRSFLSNVRSGSTGSNQDRKRREAPR
jgi:hypothetical protein